MQLNRILKALDLEANINSINIDNVVRKEDDIRSHSIFFSFTELNKKTFDQLRNKGAYLIIGEDNIYNNHYIRVSSVRKIYQKYLLWVNCKKLKKKCLIGVTGTCGKSSVSTMLYNFLKEKKKTVYFGTDGIFKNNKKINTVNTTPSMEEVFKYLDDEYYVIMEISSISFFEYRLFDIKFDYIILTNVYDDHLDYHKNKEEYIASKMLILATNYQAKVFISDDVDDRRFLRLNRNTEYYGLDNKHFRVFNIKYNSDCTTYDLETKEDYFHICSKLLGDFNVKNVSAVINVLFSLGYEFPQIVEYINKMNPIEGRYNTFEYKGKDIVIDYCHTSSSYEALLKNVKRYYNKIIVIYGAGGQRQESKRYEYSSLVSKYANYAIITNDNPREEDERKIAYELEDNLVIPHEIILDRKQAIKRGIEMIKDYDALLILGKGPEDVIKIGHKQILHSDLKTIKEIIK